MRHIVPVLVDALCLPDQPDIQGNPAVRPAGDGTARPARCRPGLLGGEVLFAGEAGEAKVPRACSVAP